MVVPFRLTATVPPRWEPRDRHRRCHQHREWNAQRQPRVLLDWAWAWAEGWDR